MTALAGRSVACRCLCGRFAHRRVGDRLVSDGRRVTRGGTPACRLVRCFTGRTFSAACGRFSFGISAGRGLHIPQTFGTAARLGVAPCFSACFIRARFTARAASTAVAAACRRVTCAACNVGLRLKAGRLLALVALPGLGPRFTLVMAQFAALTLTGLTRAACGGLDVIALVRRTAADSVIRNAAGAFAGRLAITAAAATTTATPAAAAATFALAVCGVATCLGRARLVAGIIGVGFVVTFIRGVVALILIVGFERAAWCTGLGAGCAFSAILATRALITFAAPSAPTPAATATLAIAVVIAFAAFSTFAATLCALAPLAPLG